MEPAAASGRVAIKERRRKAFSWVELDENDQRVMCSIVREIVAPGAANCETSRSILQLFVGSAVCISVTRSGAGAFIT